MPVAVDHALRGAGSGEINCDSGRSDMEVGGGRCCAGHNITAGFVEAQPAHLRQGEIVTPSAAGCSATVWRVLLSSAAQQQPIGKVYTNMPMSAVVLSQDRD